MTRFKPSEIKIIVHKKDNFRTKEILLNNNQVLNGSKEVQRTGSMQGVYHMWELIFNDEFVGFVLWRNDSKEMLTAIDKEKERKILQLYKKIKKPIKILSEISINPNYRRKGIATEILNQGLKRYGSFGIEEPNLNFLVVLGKWYHKYLKSTYNEMYKICIMKWINYNNQKMLNMIDAKLEFEPSFKKEFYQLVLNENLEFKEIDFQASKKKLFEIIASEIAQKYRDKLKKTDDLQNHPELKKDINDLKKKIDQIPEKEFTELLKMYQGKNLFE